VDEDAGALGDGPFFRVNGFPLHRRAAAKQPLAGQPAVLAPWATERPPSVPDRIE
jgi:hypothetical protein